MHQGKIGGVALVGIILVIVLLIQTHSVGARDMFQIPTVAIPTVTSSPSGATITVLMDQDQINVRGGPGTDYPVVGVLIAGQQVPATGRSVGGDWIQITYVGGPSGFAWVYSPLVDVSGSLRVIEPPPTPTPRTTPTVDPTLAAQFIVEIPPTRLPTFTAPPPLILPTFSPEDTSSGTGGVPTGLVIIGMGVVGLFGIVITILRR
jgi:uncharacterized protein YraI